MYYIYLFVGGRSTGDVLRSKDNLDEVVLFYHESWRLDYYGLSGQQYLPAKPSHWPKFHFLGIHYFSSLIAKRGHSVSSEYFYSCQYRLNS